MEANEETDIRRQQPKSMFFRPNVESASVAKASPPTKQPMKKEEAGKPVIMEDLHCKFHSEIMDDSEGKSHAHELLGSSQTLSELQEALSRAVQCHGGCASVKMLMKVC